MAFARPTTQTATHKKYRTQKNLKRNRMVRLGVNVAFFAVLLGVGAFGYTQRAELMPTVIDVIARASDARVQHIQVSGVQLTTRDELSDQLGLQKGDSLVTFKTADVRRRLESLPWVRLATVERRLPDTVRIDVYEHVPFARIQVDDTVWVANKAGDLLVEDTPQFAGLPILTGAGAADQAPALFALLQSTPNFLAQLVEASRVGERRWDLRFKSGATVQLPEGNPQRALTWLKQLDETRHVLTLAGGDIDLRLEDRITLRMPEGADAKVVLGL